jgi:hypothetical protein
MQLLAQGLERFLKVTYALAYAGRSAALPGRDDMKLRYGHKLIRITDDLVELAEQSDAYAKRPAVQEDIEFIREDADLRQLLQILSEFGSESRYHRLDKFLDPDSVEEDEPAQKWAAFETAVALRHPDWAGEVSSKTDMEKMYRRGVVHTAYLMDRFAC